MKKSRFTDSQIMDAFKRAEAAILEEGGSGIRNAVDVELQS